MEFYLYEENGNRRGPVDLAALNAWGLEGVVRPDSKIFVGDSEQAILASTIEGLHFVNNADDIAPQPDDSGYAAYYRQPNRAIPINTITAESYVKSATFLGFIALVFAFIPFFMVSFLAVLIGLAGLCFMKSAAKKGYQRGMTVRILNILAIVVAFVIGVISTVWLYYTPGY